MASTVNFIVKNELITSIIDLMPQNVTQSQISLGEFEKEREYQAAKKGKPRTAEAVRLKIMDTVIYLRMCETSKF